MKKFFYLFFALIILNLTIMFSCCNDKTAIHNENQIFVQVDSTVIADVETEAVEASSSTDAADDPSIWINQKNPEKSLLICTNKIKGLDVFNLYGELVFTNQAGKINNVDVRYGFPLSDGSKIDIAAGSNRSDNSISVFKIEEDGRLIEIQSRVLKSNLNEVYGFCLYHDHASDKFYAFVNGKSGGIEQWELFAADSGLIGGKIVRTLSVKSQPEGSVCDDEKGFYYIGEENYGIWKFKANPLEDTVAALIADFSNPALASDIEGLALYTANNGNGYLIASSQGNNSYAIFERQGANKYLGSFSIKDGPKIDGTSETDGIDVSSYSFGTIFPDGFFIAQDDKNFQGDSLLPQNFKLVSWSKITKLFNPTLLIETSKSQN